MRIIVVGGTGFIGNCLVPQLLQAGHDVTVVARGVGSHPFDVRYLFLDRKRLGEHASMLRALRPDVVVDLVLSSGAQARQLVGVFAGSASRIVAASSMDVYRATAILHGLEHGELEPLPLKEDSPRRTIAQTYPPAQIEKLQSVFGWLDAEYDKVAVEDGLHENAELPATILRLPMIYGPGDKLHRLRPLVRRMIDGRKVIVIAESLAQWRGPRGYVENVAAAIALAVRDHRAAGRTYNVGETSCSELDWAKLVTRVAGWNGRIVVLPDDKAPPHTRMRGRLEQHWVADTSLIRRELGYQESVTLEEGIRRSLDWERRQSVVDLSEEYQLEDAALGGDY